ncbi:hypothetical protein PNOK_0007800 [Pyrrhoderma noxium]|uniref:Uncharacterized protein n=1 Tax=Pyrrhoderma noxium TaxID=2282107 RepID=A0A286UTV8_9AGAM|nr:hypothetical protein PNOK_0007800 [Pyrrhoderma noxium]
MTNNNLNRIIYDKTLDCGGRVKHFNVRPYTRTVPSFTVRCMYSLEPVKNRQVKFICKHEFIFKLKILEAHHSPDNQNIDSQREKIRTFVISFRNGDDNVTTIHVHLMLNAKALRI